MAHARAQARNRRRLDVSAFRSFGIGKWIYVIVSTHLLIRKSANFSGRCSSFRQAGEGMPGALAFCGRARDAEDFAARRGLRGEAASTGFS
jgi:hypothetical protein